MFLAEATAVSEFGKMGVDTGDEGMLVCRDMLVSLNPEVKWKNWSVSDLVVSKWAGNDVDIEVTHVEEEVTPV